MTINSLQLGYLREYDCIYLYSDTCEIISCKTSLDVLEYETAIMRNSLGYAERVCFYVFSIVISIILML